jgi:hypothetical protein
MLPGIQPEALPPLLAGAVCSLRVPGSPAPIAVRCAVLRLPTSCRGCLPIEMSDIAAQDCGVYTTPQQSAS